MRPFACGQCASPVYFENVSCGRCGALLGFSPLLRRMLAFDPPPPAPAAWQARASAPGEAAGVAAGSLLRPCANRLDHQLCNWMLDVGDQHAQCRSCRLTVLIPNLQVPLNLQRWRLFEQAKRRLVFTLLTLGLPPEASPETLAEAPPAAPPAAPPRVAAGSFGLRFQLLADLPDQPPVVTGHDGGLITLNLAEADDVQREATRVSLGEPQRSLLGHLRHEASHYLQQRYIDGWPAQARCREVFGDERVDYPAALARHYAQGAPADWQQHYVSAYASAHPWEDWAETCAHYLLVVDAVQTAAAWGLTLAGPNIARPQGADGPVQAAVDELVLRQWLPVAQFLNAMNRSLGQPDPYPYQMPDAVLAKMALVQSLLHEAALPTPAGTPLEPTP